MNTIAKTFGALAALTLVSGCDPFGAYEDHKMQEANTPTVTNRIDVITVSRSTIPLFAYFDEKGHAKTEYNYRTEIIKDLPTGNAPLLVTYKDEKTAHVASNAKFEFTGNYEFPLKLVTPTTEVESQ